MWGNIKCIDRIGGAGHCNGECDGQRLRDCQGFQNPCR